MTFEFRPAVRENVPLLISISGGTGSGKTFTSLLLATGLSGGRPFALIDTEAGRAKHYASNFKFDHGDLAAPFSPDAYTQAIKAADDAHYPVIVVDSASHVHAGEGGVLDMQEAELQRMAGDDWKKREACKMAAWIKPKMAHKRMVSRLLQVRAHLILCFRAEEKVEMIRGDDGKMKILPKKTLTGRDGWVPICDKSLPFEMTCSFLLTADRPGYPQPIKLEEQHRAMFPLDKPIDENTGRALAAWASGGSPAGGTQIKPNSERRDPPIDSDVTPEEIAHETQMGTDAAVRGTDALRRWFAAMPRELQPHLLAHKDLLKPVAARADIEKPI